MNLISEVGEFRRTTQIPRFAICRAWRSCVLLAVVLCTEAAGRHAVDCRFIQSGWFVVNVTASCFVLITWSRATARYMRKVAHALWALYSSALEPCRPYCIAIVDLLTHSHLRYIRWSLGRFSCIVSYSLFGEPAQCFLKPLEYLRKLPYLVKRWLAASHENYCIF